MMKNKFKYALLFLFLSISSVAFCQLEGGDPDVPEIPSTPGPGTQATPIDMYWFYLAAVAIAFIVFAAKKYKKASV